MKFEFNRDEFTRKYLTAGGYVAKIVNCDVENDIVKVYFDICQGEFKDIFMKEYKELGGSSKFDASKWNKKGVVNFNFQYNGAKYSFANLLTFIEESNQLFKWNNELDDLKNKVVGVIYKKNSYIDKWGEVRTGTDFPIFANTKDIANGNYSIEEKNGNTSSNEQEETTTAPTFDDIQF